MTVAAIATFETIMPASLARRAAMRRNRFRACLRDRVCLAAQLNGIIAAAHQISGLAARQAGEGGPDVRSCNHPFGAGLAFPKRTGFGCRAISDFMDAGRVGEGPMAPRVGLEPTTERLTAACSTN